MPQIFKVGSYVIFFWSNENMPLEPIHVHIAENVPQPNATKVWITKAGKCVLANNNSDIPSKDLILWQLLKQEALKLSENGRFILKKYPIIVE